MTNLYNTDGQCQVTIVDGTTYTGVMSADGQYNGVLNDGSTLKSLYHPCGAFNVTIVTDRSAPRQAANGSYNIITSANGYALVGGPLWTQPGAIIDEIFTAGQYWPRTITSELADVRASTAYATDASNVWSAFLSNTTRITNAGLTNEPARTNSIRNNSMQGAVVGTPGTLPANWGSVLGPAGALAAITGITTVNGIDFIQQTVSGTPSAATNVQTSDAVTTVAATPGQVWSFSSFYQLLSGSLTAGITSCDLVLREYDSASAFLRQTSVSLQGLVAGGSVQRFSSTVTLGVSTAFINTGVRIAYTGGIAVAYNLGQGWPQLELGASVTSPIRTTTAAVTRATDAITVQRTGIGRVVFTFDDNSQQTVSGINTAAQYTLPTNLNRAIIKRMTGYTS